MYNNTCPTDSGHRESWHWILITDARLMQFTSHTDPILDSLSLLHQQKAEGNPGEAQATTHTTTAKKHSASIYCFLFLRAFDSQSRPSYRPSPLVAHVDWMYQLRFRILCRPSLSVTSAAFMAFGRSWMGKNVCTYKQWQRNASQPIGKSNN